MRLKTYSLATRILNLQRLLDAMIIVKLGMFNFSLASSVSVVNRQRQLCMYFATGCFVQFSINVYRPPNYNPYSFRTTISEITETLNTLPDIMLVGNFNLPIIKWPSRKISGGTSGDQEQARQLITLLKSTSSRRLYREQQEAQIH